MKQPQQDRRRFWRIVGVALAITVGLALIYVSLGPDSSIGAWSDALCASAMLLAMASAAPIVFDVGRGLTLAGRMVSRNGEGNADATSTALSDEHRKREKGMTVTFALALAALLVGIASIAASLW
ncbi:MAG: hypothetical protein MUF84_04670 [Anaerolineae bacterium]|jgi:hypothetical protein|nr:hypothetical protein [Anaerolineae bacterium]